MSRFRKSRGAHLESNTIIKPLTSLRNVFFPSPQVTSNVQLGHAVPRAPRPTQGSRRALHKHTFARTKHNHIPTIPHPGPRHNMKRFHYNEVQRSHVQLRVIQCAAAYGRLSVANAGGAAKERRTGHSLRAGYFHSCDYQPKFTRPLLQILTAVTAVPRKEGERGGKKKERKEGGRGERKREGDEQRQRFKENDRKRKENRRKRMKNQRQRRNGKGREGP